MILNVAGGNRDGLQKELQGVGEGVGVPPPGGAGIRINFVLNEVLLAK